MTKEQFLKELEKDLKYLNKKQRIEELKEYENLNDYNLNPGIEANKIYEKNKIKNRITSHIKFIDAAISLWNALQSKDQKLVKNIILFIISTLLFVIIIDIPFIYLRDMVSNLFNNLISTDKEYAIWYFICEILYAITAITILIKQIKKKSLEIEKNASK